MIARLRAVLSARRTRVPQQPTHPAVAIGGSPEWRALLATVDSARQDLQTPEDRQRAALDKPERARRALRDAVTAVRFRAAMTDDDQAFLDGAGAAL